MLDKTIEKLSEEPVQKTIRRRIVALKHIKDNLLAQETGKLPESLCLSKRVDLLLSIYGSYAAQDM